MVWLHHETEPCILFPNWDKFKRLWRTVAKAIESLWVCAWLVRFYPELHIKNVIVETLFAALQKGYLILLEEDQ